MEYIRINKQGDGIVLVTLDCPGKINKVSSGLLREVTEMLSVLEGDKAVKGLALVSAKEDNFVVGADIDELRAMQSREEITAYLRQAHQVLHRLASLPIPVVAGIRGSCLGGGLELALACDYRMAAEDTVTALGLPEIQLGLIPAAGGTQRLPRLIGLRKALPLMLTGGSIRVARARRLGLVDEIVAPQGLEQKAVQKAQELSRKGGKARKRRKRGWADFLLESNPLGRAIAFSQARKMIQRRTHGHYPAAFAILDSTQFGLSKGIRRGLERDVETFADLVLSPKSHAFMNLFYAMNELKKNPDKAEARPVEKLAVIGMGLMGQGIASVSAGICDTLLCKDASLEAVARGIGEIGKGLRKRAESGALTPFQRDILYGKLVPCGDYSCFTNTDLVIEAVFEDLELKRKILRDVEEAAGERTIFASNTSALPISLIAEGCRRPELVLGMHYFSPVPRMPLLEIIITPRTSRQAAATALDFGIAQGKTCIVVRDGPGFYTTRILAPLLNEAVLLVEEGAIPSEIDRAMLLFGYPVGPVTLLDEVGIDVGAHVSQSLGPLVRDRGIAVSEGLRRLYDQGYHGKKNRKGFYRYDKKKKKGQRPCDERVYAILGGAPRRTFPLEEIQNRVSLMMINEAVQCLQEGIISSPRDGDIGAVFGLGFPPFTGGPFRYIDAVGADEILRRMAPLEERFGRKFQPADLLREMSHQGKKFHS